MSRLETRTIHANPNITLHGYGLDQLHSARLIGFNFLSGYVAVNNEGDASYHLTPKQLRLALFASLGFNHQKIAQLDYSALRTVTNELSIGYRELSSMKPMDVARIGRTSLARCLLASGNLTIQAAAQPLALKPAETEALDLTAGGHTSDEIGAACDTSGQKTKALFADMVERLKWDTTQLSRCPALVMGALVSGEVGFMPQPLSHFPQLLQALEYFDIYPTERVTVAGAVAQPN